MIGTLFLEAFFLAGAFLATALTVGFFRAAIEATISLVSVEAALELLYP